MAYFEDLKNQDVVHNLKDFLSLIPKVRLGQNERGILLELANKKGAIILSSLALNTFCHPESLRRAARKLDRFHLVQNTRDAFFIKPRMVGNKFRKYFRDYTYYRNSVSLTALGKKIVELIKQDLVDKKPICWKNIEKSLRNIMDSSAN